MPSSADWMISCGAVEMTLKWKLVAFGQIIESTREEGDVVLQANAFAGFDEVFAANPAEIRVVENEIAELCALLKEVHARKSLDLVVESVETNKVAENDARVVEA